MEHVSVDRSCLIDWSMVCSTGACFGRQELFHRQEHFWNHSNRRGGLGGLSWLLGSRPLSTEACFGRQELFYRQEHGLLDKSMFRSTGNVLSIGALQETIPTVGSTGTVLSTGACFARQAMFYRQEYSWRPFQEAVDRSCFIDKSMVCLTGA